jgi:hypothetical protein
MRTSAIGAALLALLSLTSAQLQVSTDGSCGGTTKFTCKGSGFGDCCSKNGWCGSTPQHCVQGCQAGFGSCGVGGGSNSATEPSPEPSCPAAPPTTQDGPTRADPGSSCVSYQTELVTATKRVTETVTETTVSTRIATTIITSHSVLFTYSTSVRYATQTMTEAVAVTNTRTSTAVVTSTQFTVSRITQFATATMTQVATATQVVRATQTDTRYATITRVFSSGVAAATTLTTTMTRVVLQTSSRTVTVYETATRTVTVSATVVRASTVGGDNTSVNGGRDGVCVQGEVAPGRSDNLRGLCSFSCNYNYCPAGPCVCTQTARIAPAPPPSTGQRGCPVAGMDSSYSGLCSFACSHDYCPPSACTTRGC